MSFVTNIKEAFEVSQKKLNGKAIHSENTIRTEAFGVYEALGIPTIKHEEWKYSNVGAFIKHSFDFSGESSFAKKDLKDISLSKLEGNTLYFINGKYRADLSTIVSDLNQLEISNISESTESEGYKKYFGKVADAKNEAFVALNTAIPSDGVYIRIKANQTLEEPIILRFISDSREKNVGCQPRNLIIFEKNAHAKIAESYRSLGDFHSFTNCVNEIVVEEEANGEFYLVQNCSDHSYSIGSTQVLQKDKSHFYAATMTLNGGFVRNNLHLALDGQYIESFMYGLYLPNGKQHVDNHTLVDHMQPNSESNELYKGVLQDHSTGVFNGKIFVREDAQKTNAYQNCRNVLASKNATMNTKPQLEIWADDVKCSHGTTTGQLNDEALFYMQSRGIPKDEARNLLMLAFAQDVVQNIKIDSIRTYIESCILKKLNGE